MRGPNQLFQATAKNGPRLNGSAFGWSDTSMNRAWRWLFDVSSNKQSPAAIVLWWEARRIPFNLIVGVIGLCSLLLFFVFIHWAGVLKPGEDAVEPIGLLAAPVLINIAYTGGWVGQLALRTLRIEFPAVGPTLLRAGLVLSLGVAIFPSAFWGGYCLLRLFSVIG